MKKIFNYLFIFICSHLCVGAWWIVNYFGKVTGDEMLFHLFAPLNGISNDSYIDYFLLGILPTIVIASIIYFLINKYLKKKRLVYICSFMFSLLFFIFYLDIDNYIYNQVNTSKFIEDNYVNPENVELRFPKKKKNLIFIYLESMENTYSDKKNGGVQEENLIPNLTKLAKKNISFSNSKKMGGALQIAGSEWTVASMVSHTSGLPLKVNLSSNGIIDFNDFMPDVETLGDVLEENGYHNYLIAGSDTIYGGRKAYFEENGNYEIYDVNDALEDKVIKEKVFWGFDDDILYSLAKDKLLEISKEDEPFNYTILTVDTHFEDGYLSDTCGVKFNDQYADVIYCADQKIKDFLEWLEEQDFYEDTSIVIVGDHKSMDADFFNDVDESYKRTNYNVFINSSVDTHNIYNREFAAIDLYPTTLASMGVKIKGNKLGLGTNLFSDEKTLIEEYGYDYVFKELKKRSSFYNDNFLEYK